MDREERFDILDPELKAVETFIGDKVGFKGR
jgi:hypothetical protein